MYKVIYDNIVIDVIKTVKYARYLTKSKHTVITDKTSANCIIGSNNKDRYHLKGVPYPKGSNFKSVSLIEIDENEYNQLISELSSKKDSITESGLRKLKNKKIEEMSDICHKTIINGINVVLEDNRSHHFELSIEDQINLLEIKYLIDKGDSTFIYHETDCLSKEYSVNDMQKIIDESFSFKQKNLIHFNKLKNYINNLSNINDVTNVTYDINI